MWLQKEKKSPRNHLAWFKETIMNAFYQKEHLTIFFDLERTCDTTWKYGIMRDQHALSLRNRLEKFSNSFLYNRIFTIQLFINSFRLEKQEEGGLQGSILLVTLFCIKINNIVKSLTPGVEMWRTSSFATNLNKYHWTSSCRAVSTDIPDPPSPFFPIVHHLWQVFRATSFYPLNINCINVLRITNDIIFSKSKIFAKRETCITILLTWRNWNISSRSALDFLE